MQINNPTSIDSVAYYDSPGQPTSIAQNGNYLYLADGNQGIQILNISIPANPYWIGNIPIGSDELYCDNDKLYANTSGGIAIYDLLSPHNPELIGTFPLNFQNFDFVVHNHLLYAGGVDSSWRGLFQVMDISNPNNPIILDSLQPNASGYAPYVVGVSIQNGIAYLSANDIILVDISNPSDLRQVLSLDTRGSALSISIRNNTLYLCDKYAFAIYGIEQFFCGDANGDQSVDVSDCVWLANYIFVGGSPPDPLSAGDANCDDSVDVSDAVWIANYVFVGGNPPCDTDGDGIPDC